jgi:hypothetical protein
MDLWLVMGLCSSAFLHYWNLGCGLHYCSSAFIHVVLFSLQLVAVLQIINPLLRSPERTQSNRRSSSNFHQCRAFKPFLKPRKTAIQFRLQLDWSCMIHLHHWLGSQFYPMLCNIILLYHMGFKQSALRSPFLHVFLLENESLHSFVPEQIEMKIFFQKQKWNMNLPLCPFFFKVSFSWYGFRGCHVQVHCVTSFEPAFQNFSFLAKAINFTITQELFPTQLKLMLLCDTSYRRSGCLATWQAVGWGVGWGWKQGSFTRDSLPITGSNFPLFLPASSSKGVFVANPSCQALIWA